MRKLHLGCGREIWEGWVNLDLAPLKGVDVVWNIEKTPWPFQDNEFDLVYAKDILEHVEYVSAMREIHRILKPGGRLQASVPHFTSRDNWIDPTHRHSFSIRTFEFFVQDSRFERDYYWDFAFKKLHHQKIVFEKSWLVYNYLVEPLIHIHPKIGVLYEATALHSLFPAKAVQVELEK